MTDKRENPAPPPQQPTLEGLATNIKILLETVGRLSDNVDLLNDEDETQDERIRLLEKQELSFVLNKEETKEEPKEAKIIMADELKTELEKQLNACKGKIKSLLFRAKFVDKKGLRITGEIDMKNPDDIKEKERIGRKLSETITTYKAYKAYISTLTARAIWVDVKNKALEYRVRVSINVK